MTMSNFDSGITPGIARRPEPFAEHDNVRVGGRAHAVVSLRPKSYGAVF